MPPATESQGQLEELAFLLKVSNQIQSRIARMIGRPCLTGHLGEWLASKLFDIELCESATQAGFDGRFRTGPLKGKSVNIKWYLKRANEVDLTKERDRPDYYLVMTGPPSRELTSKGSSRPWALDSAFLFEARSLHEDLESRGLFIGVGSSVRTELWGPAQVFPPVPNSPLEILPEQEESLKAFHSSSLAGNTK